MSQQSKKLTIVPAPFDLGQPKSGTDLGPQSLLDAGLESQLQELGWQTQVKRIQFHKAASDPPHATKVKNPRSVGNVCEQVARHVGETLAAGNVALTLGGDHSLGLGTVAGTSRVFGQEFCVIWVDAHAV